MKHLEDVQRLTLYEYKLLMKACQLKTLDNENKLHKLAWMIEQAKATKQKGKKTVPYFKTYKDFFDYDRYEKDILGEPKEDKKDNAITNLLVKANS